MGGCALAAMLAVAVTAYSPDPRENWGNPWETACGTRPRVGTVAVSQDLFAGRGPARTGQYRCGDRLRLWVGGRWQVFVVNDTMHRSAQRTVDIWRPTRQDARRAGRRVGWVCRSSQEQSALLLPPY